MRRARALGSTCFALAFVPLACTMENPAFEDDDELGDESSSDESTTRMTDDEGGSSEGTSDSSSNDETTQSSTLDTTSTSDDTTSETTDTSESETGMTCADGLTDCEGNCVDVGADPMNCGECGIECADNELCIGACSPKKYVFVSSEPLNGAMGTILGADEFCATLALEAGLPGTYLAWNSTDLSYPDIDFVKEGVYIRTDGHIVALSYEDLTDGSLAMPINVDENQLEALLAPVAACPNVSGPVWSNTTPTGEYAGGSACTGWISGSNLTTGKIGKSIATDGSWSQVLDCNVPCGAFLPIYCVQQDP